MAKKKKIWNFKTEQSLIERLKRAAVVTDQSAAQIAREAIADKLNEMAESFPEIDAKDEPHDEPVAA